MNTLTSRVQRATATPESTGQWDGPVWGPAVPLVVDRFHPRSSDHHPLTEVKLLHTDETLHALFRVHDRWVRSVHTEYESDTYRDSCVELFLQPAGRVGYFAFEVNAGGAFSLRYIEDPTRTPDRFAKWQAVPGADAARIRVAHALPRVVEPEIVDPVTWWVEVAWPLGVMEPCCGPLGALAGQRWRGNAFKCGDETSHPHWASWSPIGPALNFHAPEWFGTIEFE